MLIYIFQLLLPFNFRLLILLYSISPTSDRSSHPTLDRNFGAYTSEIFSTKQGVLVFRHSCLLAKHRILLYTMLPVVRPLWGFVRAQDISIVLPPPRNLHGLVTVRDREASMLEAIFLIYTSDIFISSLTLLVDRRSHQSS